MALLSDNGTELQLVSADCLPLENLNLTANGSCSNGSSILNQKPPTRVKEMDSLRIVLYVLIFLLSVFGNLLIILVLMLNKRMRTVTNSFLLSLAVSDLMIGIFCMPFTLIPNILEDFIFGASMCKIVTYFMATTNLLEVVISSLLREHRVQKSPNGQPQAGGDLV